MVFGGILANFREISEKFPFLEPLAVYHPLLKELFELKELLNLKNFSM